MKSKRIGFSPFHDRTRGHRRIGDSGDRRVFVESNTTPALFLERISALKWQENLTFSWLTTS
jgi:hypothetical protein